MSHRRSRRTAPVVTFHKVHYSHCVPPSTVVEKKNTANVPVVNQGKTKFVKEYLAEHGDAKRAAINEAWQAAGHKDEISESLVYKMRSQHGLTTRQGNTEEPRRPPKRMLNRHPTSRI